MDNRKSHTVKLVDPDGSSLMFVLMTEPEITSTDILSAFGHVRNELGDDAGLKAVLHRVLNATGWRAKDISAEIVIRF